jgi:hypothetical protein
VPGREREGLEDEAVALLRFAGANPREPPSPQELVIRLLGPGAVRVVPPEALPVGGALARVGATWRVYLRSDLAPAQARFTLLHELAHWVLGPDATEPECDALAACLLAPREAFERAIVEAGPSYQALAAWFRCNESFAALRFSEVTGEPLALVAPSSVRLRGSSWPWPTEERIRELARGRPIPGLRKARLRDDPARIVVRAKGR